PVDPEPLFDPVPAASASDAPSLSSLEQPTKSPIPQAREPSARYLSRFKFGRKYFMRVLRFKSIEDGRSKISLLAAVDHILLKQLFLPISRQGEPNVPTLTTLAATLLWGCISYFVFQ